MVEDKSLIKSNEEEIDEFYQMFLDPLTANSRKDPMNIKYEKIETNSDVFTNFWQAEKCEDWFYNVDVCEEVTERIKSDEKYCRCRELYPNHFIGQKANISVNVDNGRPYILRDANGLGKAEFEITDVELIESLFTSEELATLKEIAEKVRQRNEKMVKQKEKLGFSLIRIIRNNHNKIYDDIYKALYKNIMEKSFVEFEKKINETVEEVKKELDSINVDNDTIGFIFDKMQDICIIRDDIYGVYEEDDCIKVTYTVEDALYSSLDNLYRNLTRIMLTELPNYFLKNADSLIKNKKDIIDEIENELVNKDVEKNAVKSIIDKLRKINLSYYDYKDELYK